MLAEAERILAKYGDDLPVATNQVYNKFLKEIGQTCGIEAEKMTSHVGRKTAGTLMLNLGIPLPAVSKFLGHANTLITQKLYAKLLDSTVIDAFAQVFGTGVDIPVVLPTITLHLPAPVVPYDEARALKGERTEKWGTHSNKPTTRPANRIRVRDLFKEGGPTL